MIVERRLEDDYLMNTMVLKQFWNQRTGGCIILLIYQIPLYGTIKMINVCYVNFTSNKKEGWHHKMAPCSDNIQCKASFYFLGPSQKLPKYPLIKIKVLLVCKIPLQQVNLFNYKCSCWSFCLEGIDKTNNFSIETTEDRAQRDNVLVERI